jgi:hypothetical protein
MDEEISGRPKKFSFDKDNRLFHHVVDLMKSCPTLGEPLWHVFQPLFLFILFFLMENKTSH